MSEQPNTTPELISLLNNGKRLFEIEKYPDAIAQLQQAQILANSSNNSQTALGGEIQIWLANAYDAIGETKRAIAICQKLINHSDPTINKQANFLISIFSAPEINKLENVTSTLPPLAMDRSQAPKSFNASQLSSDPANKATDRLTTENRDPLKQNYLLIWFLITLTGIIILSLSAILLKI